MQLYPLKFKPRFYSKIWGGQKIQTYTNHNSSIDDHIGESWDISQIKDNESVVSNGTLKDKTLSEVIQMNPVDVLGKIVSKNYGNEFPLLVKLIDANSNLSIQVHPDDKMAKEYHESFGKTEMWYVLDADEDAFLISGFTHRISPEEYLESVEKNTIENTLKKFEVKSGDIFYIPAGCVHAIGKGCVILEVQQSSDITYRIYDYNRKDKNGDTRELHSELASKAIKFDNWKSSKINTTSKNNCVTKVIEGEYFENSILEMNEPVSIINNGNSFQIISCTFGDVHLIYNNEEISLQKGESILLPACLREVQVVPENQSKLLITKINQ